MEYACPDCGVNLTDQGLFGERGNSKFRRYQCDNSECAWKGTSYPEASLIRRLHIGK